MEDISPSEKDNKVRTFEELLFPESAIQYTPSSTIQPIDVGGQLRHIRTEKGFSIRALAEVSGLNANTLSMIENRKTSPSVSTLQRLAEALEVPITDFFNNDVQRRRVIFQRHLERAPAFFDHGTIEDLSAGMVSRRAQPMIVTLKPKATSGNNPIVHTGQEFVYCLAGKICYTVDRTQYLLTPGDSLLFEAHLPHQWENLLSSPSKVLLVLCPSDERDRPAQHHFTVENGSAAMHGG